jgi:hypothetical protein
MTTDKTSRIMAWLLKRLPMADMIPLPEIAVAVDVNPHTVEGWIDSGEVDAVDIGGRSKHYWLISRASFIEFWQRRELGIRAQATPRILRQQALFADHEINPGEKGKKP